MDMNNSKNTSTANLVLVGDNIRKWRELRSIKQQLLASQLGITPGALSNIENNKSCINIDRLQQIACCLQIDVTMLFSNPLDLITPRGR
jgi:transcriptional regulator with XRE-family HTH domain